MQQNQQVYVIQVTNSNNKGALTLPLALPSPPGALLPSEVKYSASLVQVLGGTHLVLGTVLFVLGVLGSWVEPETCWSGAGVWGGICTLICGTCGILAYHLWYKNYTIKAFLVSSVVCVVISILAIVLIIYALFNRHEQYYHLIQLAEKQPWFKPYNNTTDQEHQLTVSVSANLMVGFIFEFLLAIWSVNISWKGVRSEEFTTKGREALPDDLQSVVSTQHNGQQVPLAALYQLIQAHPELLGSKAIGGGLGSPWISGLDDRPSHRSMDYQERVSRYLSHAIEHPTAFSRPPSTIQGELQENPSPNEGRGSPSSSADTAVMGPETRASNVVIEKPNTSGNTLETKSQTNAEEISVTIEKQNGRENINETVKILKKTKDVSVMMDTPSTSETIHKVKLQTNAKEVSMTTEKPNKSENVKELAKPHMHTQVISESMTAEKPNIPDAKSNTTKIRVKNGELKSKAPLPKDFQEKKQRENTIENKRDIARSESQKDKAEPADETTEKQNNLASEKVVEAEGNQKKKSRENRVPSKERNEKNLETKEKSSDQEEKHKKKSKEKRTKETENSSSQLRENQDVPDTLKHEETIVKKEYKSKDETEESSEQNENQDVPESFEPLPNPEEKCKKKHKEKRATSKENKDDSQAKEEHNNPPTKNMDERSNTEKKEKNKKSKRERKEETNGSKENDTEHTEKKHNKRDKHSKSKSSTVVSEQESEDGLKHITNESKNKTEDYELNKGSVQPIAGVTEKSEQNKNITEHILDIRPPCEFQDNETEVRN